MLAKRAKGGKIKDKKGKEKRKGLGKFVIGGGASLDRGGGGGEKKRGS